MEQSFSHLLSVTGARRLQAFMAVTGVNCSRRVGDIVSAVAPLAEAVARLGGTS